MSRPRLPLSLWLAATVAILTVSGVLLISLRSPGTVAVHVAKRDLPAFRAVTTGDVELESVQQDEAKGRADAAIGEILVRPVEAGQVLKSRDLVSEAAASGAGPLTGDSLVGAPATSAQTLGGTLTAGSVVRVTTTTSTREQADLTVLAVTRSTARGEPPYVLLLAVPAGQRALESALASGAYQLVAPLQ